MSLEQRITLLPYSLRGKCSLAETNPSLTLYRDVCGRRTRVPRMFTGCSRSPIMIAMEEMAVSQKREQISKPHGVRLLNILTRFHLNEKMPAIFYIVKLFGRSSKRLTLSILSALSKQGVRDFETTTVLQTRSIDSGEISNSCIVCFKLSRSQADM